MTELSHHVPESVSASAVLGGQAPVIVVKLV